MLDLKKLGELSGVERILLSTDGSITDILEVLYGGVYIQLLGQECGEVPPHMRHIFKTSTSLNSREVLLCSTQAHIQGIPQAPLMYAQSLCDFSLLPLEAKNALEQGQMPIGRVLEHFKIETRREILDVECKHISEKYRALFGYEAGQDMPCRTQGEGGQILKRRYIIYHAQKPLFYIKEVFVRGVMGY